MIDPGTPVHFAPSLSRFALSLVALAAVLGVAYPCPASAQGVAIGPERLIRGTVREAPLRRPKEPVSEDEAAASRAPQGPPRRDEEADEDGDGEQPPTGPQDGDMVGPLEPGAPRDGEVDVGEPRSPDDGAPERVDGRLPGEADAFEKPPAGYDPSVFSIEIIPLEDRRPARFIELDPYRPIGIRMGSFLLFPEIEAALLAQDNIFRTPLQRKSDVALEVRPSLRAVSDWRAHAVELRATGNASFHNEYPSEDDRAYLIEGRGRLDITRRTSLEALVSRERTQESRASINAVPGTLDRGDVDTSRAGFAFNHRFNRLSIQLRGVVTEVDYAPVLTETGVLARNDDRDIVTREAAVRATWEFKPTLSAFVETAVNDRAYNAPSTSDGLIRNSTGERYRLGLAFGTGPSLRGEASVGYGRQRYSESRLPEIDGVLVDANLGWRFSELTSLLLTARSEIGETTVAGVGGAFNHTVGLEVRHAFRRHLIGLAGVRYTQQDYEGAELVERELVSTLGVEYFANRNVVLFARYNNINYDASSPDREYSANEVRVGLRVRR